MKGEPLSPNDLHPLAILLDVDGTLLDIAASPSEVVIPDGLLDTLVRASGQVGGALALVSGRPIAGLDDLFAPLRLPAVGGHGAEMRLTSGGAVISHHVPSFDPDLKQRLRKIADRYPGVLLEDKGYSIAVHYRKAPEHERALIGEVSRAFADEKHGSPFELLPGKAVIEIKFTGFNKGTGVRELMAHPPFVGRAPIYVGDDRTDEDAFAAMPEFNGRGISVGKPMVGAEATLESPADVRRWLTQVADDADATAGKAWNFSGEMEPGFRRAR